MEGEGQESKHWIDECRPEDGIRIVLITYWCMEEFLEVEDPFGLHAEQLAGIIVLYLYGNGVYPDWYQSQYTQISTAISHAQQETGAHQLRPHLFVS